VSKLRIVVLGYLVRGPIGGMAWHHLQYVLGLQSLGHDVYFAEDSDDYPSCYDPSRGLVDCDPSYGLQFCEHIFRRVGMADRWCYYDAHQAQWHGPAAGRALNLFSTADVVLNLSGVNPLRSWAENIPVRALVDTDPLFTQIRHLTDRAAKERAAQHTAFFTFGENIPGGRSVVPDDGFPWQATRQPIALDWWPVTPGPTAGRFTSVMQWDSYPAVEHAGQRYAMKSQSFEPFVELPQQIGPKLELALGSASAPRDRLLANGWSLRDPLEVTRDPWTYQKYLQESKAEFGIAKQGYVVSRCGWFSERSAGYLASGRPCLVQETGFSEHIPTGDGLIAFGSPDEAIEGVADIERHYADHCQAARAIAAEFFDARQVLSHLLQRAGNASAKPASTDRCISDSEFSREPSR
jgi:hypothetical protein